MKILKRLSIILILFVLISIPVVSRAETVKAQIDQTTEYISEETKQTFDEFVQVKEGYTKFVIIEVCLLLIVVLAIWKTTAIETSTKVFAMIAILGLFAFVLRFSIDGKIIDILDIFIQTLGVIIILMANYFIYKHDNLLIYVPVYIVGMAYCFNYLVFVKDNFICKGFLIAAPIVLYCLGFLKQKADEEIFMKPVDIKHDNNNDNKE